MKLKIERKNRGMKITTKRKERALMKIKRFLKLEG